MLKIIPNIFERSKKKLQFRKVFVILHMQSKYLDYKMSGNYNYYLRQQSMSFGGENKIIFIYKKIVSFYFIFFGVNLLQSNRKSLFFCAYNINKKI